MAYPTPAVTNTTASVFIPEIWSDEIIAAYKREGAAVTKRENVHRMADANKAFAHFAW